jgi:hypothetical protein
LEAEGKSFAKMALHFAQEAGKPGLFKIVDSTVLGRFELAMETLTEMSG